LWWDSAGGQLYLWYADPNSSAWVVAANPPGTGAAPLDSPVFTGDPQAPTRSVGDADNSLATTAFTQTAVAPALNNVGRNVLHNSLINVQQRGAGPFTTGNTADRWLIIRNVDAPSVSVVTLADAGRAAIGDEVATSALACVFAGTAGDTTAFSSVQQRIEGGTRRLSGKTVTVSFWAAAVGTSVKLGVSLDQNFGNGGSNSAAVQGAGQSVTLPLGWQHFSLTFTVPSSAGKTFGTNLNDYLALIFWYSSGGDNAARAGSIGIQSSTVYIWGVQLEVGAVATALEKIEYADDLRHCMRYYQTGAIGLYGYGLAANTVGSASALPVPMRATPTVTPNFTQTVNVGSQLVTSYGGNSGVVMQAVATATGSFAMQATYTASAEL
jgi:hypothetical protein